MVSMNPVAAAVCVESDVGVESVIAHEGKVHRHSRARASAPARFRKPVHNRTRTDKSDRVHSEVQAASLDRATTLELVASKVDTRSKESRERAFDSVTLHRFSNVALGTPGMIHQSRVR